MKYYINLKVWAYIVFVLLIATNASAQKNLSLEEAMQLSLQNNKQLRLSQAKVKEAAATLRQAKDRRLPDVDATGAYMRLDDPKVDLKLKLGAPQPGAGQAGESNPLSSVKIEQVSYGIVSASLPLFSGFRIQYGVESQKYLLEATKLDADNDKESVVQNTINAYSNLYKAQLSVSLISENLKNAEKRVRDFSVREKNGELIHNDVLQAQLQRSNIKLSLMDARNNLDMAIVNMDLMLGLPEDIQLVADSNAFSRLEEAGTIGDWEQKALTNRKDIASISYKEKAAMAGVNAAKGEYFPSLALTGNYIAADIPSLLSVTDALGIGLGLKYNFGSLWKTSAKVAEVKAQQEQLIVTADMLNDQVRIEINQAYKDYLLSVQKIDVYAEGITEANENYKVIQSKYDNKAATTTDLLNADTAQLQAELNYTFSKADAVVAYKKLLRTAGMLVNDLNATSK